jgi:hypothetical protein
MLSGNLVDWALVGRSALWLLGLSVVLAGLSFAEYRAAQQRRPMKEVLARPVYQQALSGGLGLVCLGLLAGSPTLWEAGVWAAFSAGFAYLAWSRRR